MKIRRHGIGISASTLAALTLALVPASSGAQADAGTGKVGAQTSVAVKLISKNHAQTGTATLTQQRGGVHVSVLLDQPPSGNEVAIIRKGGCPIEVSSSTTTTSNAATGAGANGGTANGTDTGAMSGGSMYQIGPIKPTQGVSGQSAGVAETTLRNVSLSNLVQNGYTVDITAGTGGTSAPLLCSDLQNALPPTTPAGSQ